MTYCAAIYVIIDIVSSESCSVLQFESQLPEFKKQARKPGRSLPASITNKKIEEGGIKTVFYNRLEKELGKIFREELVFASFKATAVHLIRRSA
jgi:hypothetical protein